MTEVAIKPKTNTASSVKHKIGNWYRHEDGVTLVVLANVKGKAVLITTDGHFWAEPVEYEIHGGLWGLWVLNQEQFDAVANGGKKFTLVSKITISEE